MTARIFVRGRIRLSLTANPMKKFIGPIGVFQYTPTPTLVRKSWSMKLSRVT